MIRTNRISLSRLFLCAVIMIFSTEVLAEYYIVYPSSAAPCCKAVYHPKVYKKVHKVKYKKHYKHPCKKTYRKVYYSPRIEKYYVWQSCCGVYWVPTCDTCGNFYVPREYYYRRNYYNYDSYYYDPAVDWDMRTMDDY